MFIRFRAIRHRLVVNLVATRRRDGKVVSEHIARLGSAALPEPISAAERILFWRDLKDRWRDLIERLGNRVTAEDRKKALAAIHARIPKPTEADEQAMRIEAVRGILVSVDANRATLARRVEDERKSIAEREAALAETLAAIGRSEGRSYKTQAHLVRLLAGGRVEGDDKVMADHVTTAAAIRDADIRAEPRPAARGRRGPQKRQERPHWRATRPVTPDEAAL